MTTTYSRTQILLHWGILVLIALQFLLHKPIAHAWRKVEKGLPYDFHPLILAHIIGGLLILGLVVWRVFLRVKRGAPELPANEPAVLKLAAHATHMGLYILMLLLPISGAAAWFGGVGAAAQAHEIMKSLLFYLVGLHFLGALYQQFILKTNIMARMR